MNLTITSGEYGRDINTSTANAVIADETALGQTASGTTFCDVQLTALATPANTVVAQISGAAAGSTSYTYVVADAGNAGTFAPATGVALTTGAATITAVNANLITWSGIGGHTYNIYRSASSGTPSSTGLIGTVTLSSNSVGSFTDTGIAATGNVPTANTTGALKPAGPLFTNQVVMKGGNVQTVSTTAAATLTAANILNELCVFTGGAALTFTLPTAAILVAALPGIQVNSSFRCIFRNTNSGSATLAVSTGATSASGNTLATISLHAKEVFFQFTNVTPGSEAYTVYTAMDTAY